MDALNTLGRTRPLWDKFASLLSSRVYPLLTKLVHWFYNFCLFNTPLATVVVYPPPRQTSQKNHIYHQKQPFDTILRVDNNFSEIFGVEIRGFCRNKVCKLAHFNNKEDVQVIWDTQYTVIHFIPCLFVSLQI